MLSFYQNPQPNLESRTCKNCGLIKPLQTHFHSKGRRHESICKSCSNKRKREVRQSANKVKASAQHTPEQVLAKPSESQPPSIESTVSSEANSGDPWAKFGKMYEEPLDLHSREQIKQNLCGFFELLSRLKLDVAKSTLTEQEAKDEISTSLRNS